MFNKLSFAWTVAVIAIVVALVGWYQANKYLGYATLAQQKLKAQDTNRSIADSLELSPVTFLAVRNSTLVYGVPKQTQRDGQVFVDRVTDAASISADTDFGGAPGTNALEALKHVQEGTPLRIKTQFDARGINQLQAVIINL